MASATRAPHAAALPGFLRYALFLPLSAELLVQSQGQPAIVLQQQGQDRVLDPFGKLGMHPMHMLVKAVTADDEAAFGIRL